MPTATRSVIPSAVRRLPVADLRNPHRQTRQPSPSFAPIGRARTFRRRDRLTANPIQRVSYTNASIGLNDMQVSLEGKVAVVTGVSGDGQVGQAVAKALADTGAALAICARTQSNVEVRAKELRDASARVFAMAGS